MTTPVQDLASRFRSGERIGALAAEAGIPWNTLWVEFAKLGVFSQSINEIPAQRRRRSLLAHILARGGISPARARGWKLPLTIIRLNGTGLDEMAEALHNAGIIRIPDTHQGDDYLAELLSRGAAALDEESNLSEEEKRHYESKGVVE